jgi:hypothetical protein
MKDLAVLFHVLRDSMELAVVTEFYCFPENLKEGAGTVHESRS